MKCFVLLATAALAVPCSTLAQAPSPAPLAPAAPAAQAAPATPAAPAVPAPAVVQTGIAGDWREPSGSIIRIAPCGPALCASLVFISSAAPVRVDGNNPDASLRTRPLCGLQIGEGFRGPGPNHADGGHLYDPKNGKTYKGTMASEGNTLLLRGYIGISMFGRTARWDRVTTPTVPCTAAARPGAQM